MLLKKILPVVAGLFVIIMSCTFTSGNGDDDDDDDDKPDVVIADQYESDNTKTTAKSIAPDSGSQNRTLKKSDTDWVSFSAVTGKAYKIYTEGSTDTRIKVYSSSGSQPIIEGDDSPGNANAVVVFNCTSSGTYYFAVFGNDESVSGSYKLIVATSIGTDAYEPDSLPAFARSISVNATQTRSIAPGDEDWITCSITGGDSVLVRALPSGDITLALYDRDTSTQISKITSDDSIVSIRSRVSTTGIYFIRVTSPDSSKTHSYRLNLQTSTGGILDSNDQYENDDTKATAKKLPGTSVVQQRSLSEEDTDWVALPVLAGRQYTISVSNTSYVNAIMYAKDGTLLLGPLPTLSLNSSENDTVYIKIFSQYDEVISYSLTVSVLLPASVPDEFEPDNVRSKAMEKCFEKDSLVQDRTLTLEGSVPDTDYIAFPVIASKVYTIKATTVSSTTMYMYLYEKNATSYTRSVSSSGSSISYTPTVSDTVVLMVFRPSSYGALSYSLSITGKISNDTYEPDSSRATAKSISTSSQSRILIPNDTDWVMYTAQPGDTVVVQTSGSTDTKLALFSSTGSTPLEEGDNISETNKNGMVSWKSPLGGQFYIRITGKTASVNGSYTLQAQSSVSGTLVVADSFEVDDTKTKARIVTDTLLNAEVHSLTVSDTDWIAFPAAAGSQYTITMSANNSISVYGYTAKDSLFMSRVSYTNPSITRVSTVKDTLYFKVFSAGTVAVGRYTISMSRVAAPEPDLFEDDNSKAKARLIKDTVLTNEAHTLPAGDTDWVAVPVAAGSQYTLSFATVNSSNYLTVYAYTAKDSLFLSRVSYSSTSMARLSPYADTLYYRITSTGSVARYTISMTRIAAPEPDVFEADNTKAKARIIADTSLVNEVHSLPAGDTDWVAFPAVAGSQYTVSFSSTNSISIYAYTAKDSLFLSRVSYTSTSMTRLTPYADSLYFRITSTTYTPRYTISMTRVLPPNPDSYELDNTREQAKMIPADTLQSRTLTVRDSDWVAIELASGNSYQVVTSAAFSHYVYLYRGKGATSYLNYSSGSAANMSVSPLSAAETLYVLVTQYSTTSISYAGSYTIRVNRTSVGALLNSPITTGIAGVLRKEE